MREKKERKKLERYQSRGLYLGLNYEDYRNLKKEEIVLTKSKERKVVTVDEVVADMERNGGSTAAPLWQTFLSQTEEGSRKAYCQGMFGNVVYVAKGMFRLEKSLQLILASIHRPGMPDGNWVQKYWSNMPARSLRLQATEDTATTYKHIKKGEMLAEAYEVEHFYKTHTIETTYLLKEGESFCTMLRGERGIARNDERK